VGVPHSGDWARLLDNLLAKECHLDAPPQSGSEVPHVFMFKVLFVHFVTLLLYLGMLMRSKQAVHFQRLILPALIILP
jgi:hypothetical protein